MNVLRPSLLPGLLDSLRHNVSRKNDDVALFEIGAGLSSRATARHAEERRVAIALTGQRHRLLERRRARTQVRHLRSEGRAGGVPRTVRPARSGFTRATREHALFLESAAITLGGKLELGEFGQLLPALAEAL